MNHFLVNNLIRKINTLEILLVESSLLNVLSDHLNAEIVSGTISTKQEALDYLTWTYFFRRLLVNPSYYNMEPLPNDTNEQTTLNTYLSAIVQRSLDELTRATCIFLNDIDQRTLQATVHGKIASHYYISYKTIHMFAQRLTSTITIGELIDIISCAYEYNEMPVKEQTFL
jgi:activating signal cointegrator complex subunit 3